ncbi:hypothetical protein BC937DRAFT_92214 [Endogone sp. FLAS-F59071]|nr:hypothetical protein BC937DRAFT_92214 [Endogone sp. FLAS-F59071]|eukprot:RUS23125.1 hypothetical protein BC937DRAFT_92214 [Endogone sp. FLAS-F59071]
MSPSPSPSPCSAVPLDPATGVRVFLGGRTAEDELPQRALGAQRVVAADRRSGLAGTGRLLLGFLDCRIPLVMKFAHGRHQRVVCIAKLCGDLWDICSVDFGVSIEMLRGKGHVSSVFSGASKLPAFSKSSVSWRTGTGVPWRTGTGVSWPTGTGVSWPTGTGTGVSWPTGTGTGVSWPTGTGVPDLDLIWILSFN